MTNLGKLVEYLAQLGRKLRLRWLFGVSIPRNCQIGRNVSISGSVKVGSGVIIKDDVILDGQITIGERSVIDRQIEMRGNIEIGDGCVIGPFSIITTAPHAAIRVGMDTYINSYNVLGASSAISIGKHCIFAPFVQITDAAHAIDERSTATKHAGTNSTPVEIGENVWLGSGVVVLKGARIGNDAVVGAKSLVRGDLPDRSVSFGTPAEVRRIRE